MSVHSFRKYKESLAILPDIEEMIKILALTEKALSFYSHYIPAYKVISTVKDQKTLLLGYQKELMQTKKNKGIKV